MSPTAQLDKASLIDRAKRQRTADTMPTDIFASSLVSVFKLARRVNPISSMLEYSLNPNMITKPPKLVPD